MLRDFERLRVERAATARQRSPALAIPETEMEVCIIVLDFVS